MAGLRFEVTSLKSLKQNPLKFCSFYVVCMPSIHPFGKVESPIPPEYRGQMQGRKIQKIGMLRMSAMRTKELIETDLLPRRDGLVKGVWAG